MDYELRAKKVKLLVFDVDGVLTGGELFLGAEGEVMKTFNTQDGLGIAAAHRAGLKTAIITGRLSEMVKRRGQELAIGDVVQGAQDKVAALGQLITKHGLAVDEVGYVGDDLNDLGVMNKVGLACAVANAVPEVKKIAHFMAQYQGGHGAVREIIEMVLKVQGKWDTVVATYCQAGALNAGQ
ncbi:MAG: kdsC [Firmicutes bacterium]|nr:kdsC [Bacillota bacterium]